MDPPDRNDANSGERVATQENKDVIIQDRISKEKTKSRTPLPTSPIRSLIRGSSELLDLAPSPKRPRQYEAKARAAQENNDTFIENQVRKEEVKQRTPLPSSPIRSLIRSSSSDLSDLVPSPDQPRPEGVKATAAQEINDTFIEDQFLTAEVDPRIPLPSSPIHSLIWSSSSGLSDLAPSPERPRQDEAGIISTTTIKLRIPKHKIPKHIFSRQSSPRYKLRIPKHKIPKHIFSRQSSPRYKLRIPKHKIPKHVFSRESSPQDSMEALRETAVRRSAKHRFTKKVAKKQARYRYRDVNKKIKKAKKANATPPRDSAFKHALKVILKSTTNVPFALESPDSSAICTVTHKDINTFSKASDAYCWFIEALGLENFEIEKLKMVEERWVKSVAAATAAVAAAAANTTAAAANVAATAAAASITATAATVDATAAAANAATTIAVAAAAAAAVAAATAANGIEPDVQELRLIDTNCDWRAMQKRFGSVHEGGFESTLLVWLLVGKRLR